MKILDAIWFNLVGIVKVETEFDGVKYYIGVGLGNNEQMDRRSIATWGNPFPKSAGDKLFGIQS